jgi:CheY-like chemotaxis protein
MSSRNPAKKEGQKTVLVVEDQKSNLIVLEKLLEWSDIYVISAENGEEAINICRENKNIDLVLMDLKMPVMDGYEAMTEIKKISPGIRVVAETAYALPGDKQKILEAGFDGYLPKPITRQSLKAILDSNLEP